MNNIIKDIDIINHTYYFYNGIINLQNFDPNQFKIDAKSYKSILFYYIGYVAMKDSKYVQINSVILLYVSSAQKIDTLQKLIKIDI